MGVSEKKHQFLFFTYKVCHRDLLLGRDTTLTNDQDRQWRSMLDFLYGDERVTNRAAKIALSETTPSPVIFKKSCCGWSPSAASYSPSGPTLPPPSLKSTSTATAAPPSVSSPLFSAAAVGTTPADSELVGTDPHPT